MTSSTGRGSSALEKSLGYLLQRAQQRAEAEFARELDGLQLSFRYFLVLAAVAEQPGASQTELVLKTGIDRSTLAEAVGRLEKRGFLLRTRDGEDRRANAVHLSDKGAAAFQEAQQAAARADSALVKPLSRKRQENLHALLEAFEKAHRGHEREKDASTEESPKVKRKATAKSRAKEKDKETGKAKRRANKSAAEDDARNPRKANKGSKKRVERG